ncbi:protease HtpX [Candidatus Dependentiae bacterium]|nr:MAG: protease HtpX [Candidatus Dependentiae bacterium]
MINKIKTVLLLATLSGLLLMLGALFGGITGLQYAFILALIMNGIAYFFSDTIVLRLYKAQPMDSEQYSWVYATVHELTSKMGIPMPKLWIIKTPMANAFATGRNPGHASVALTTGIMDLLSKDELRGVLAHELSHIKNRDILIATIAATVATAIGYLANCLQYAAYWGSLTNGKRRANPLGLLLVAIFMPFAAMLIQLAISRSREYLADETGAYYSQDPLSLASALEKLHHNISVAHLDNNDTHRASTASLFIVYPFSARNWLKLFSTHPPLEARIAHLHKLYEKNILL